MLTFAIKKKCTPSIAPKRHVPAVSPMSHSLHLQRAKVRHILRSPTLQPKLTIGQPNDKYEQEADRVADEVMRMPEPGVQRQVEPEEEEEETLQAKPLASQITPLAQVQRQEEPEKEEEEEILQTKEVPDKTPEVTPDLESRIQALRGGGQPFPESVRAFFDRRFCYDFSDKRIHTDSRAAGMARELNARAFTVGRDVVFGSGQYSPETSSGKKLLAHELTHTVQQNYRQSRIQRKIIVAGNQYTPTAKYYTWLDNHSYSSMKEFIKRMHNGGNPPDYNFSSYTQMGREVRLRNQALKGMEEVNTNGSVNYGSPHKLDTAYWDKVGPTHFTVKSPLPAGKKASDAIESIFKAGADNRLECNSLMVAVQYRAMMTGLGKAKFNAKFPNGNGILISPHHDPRTGATPHPIWDKNFYKQITISGESDLLPGDWVYFKNYGDYITWNPGGLWSGEHALYMGGGKYQGFGPATFAGGTSMTKEVLEQRLCDKYNVGADAAHQKTYTASTSVYPYGNSIVGLRDYARRPVIKEIDK